MLLLGNHGVFEKRARALTIGIARNQQHSFPCADVANRFTRLSKIGRGLAAFEVLLQIGIADARLALREERVGYAENDESPALRRVKYAGAVGKSAGFPTQLAHLVVFPIEDLNRFDRLRYFLSVCAHILHRSAANASRDSTQTLDAGAPFYDRVRDEAIPGFACTNVESSLSVVLARVAIDAGDGHS